jgi:hypothetical protein
MKQYTTYYISTDGERISITLDLEPFLADGLKQYQAIEQAAEVFERSTDNFKEW